MQRAVSVETKPRPHHQLQLRDLQTLVPAVRVVTESVVHLWLVVTAEMVEVVSSLFDMRVQRLHVRQMNPELVHMLL